MKVLLFYAHNPNQLSTVAGARSQFCHSIILRHHHGGMRVVRSQQPSANHQHRRCPTVPHDIGGIALRSDCQPHVAFVEGGPSFSMATDASSMPAWLTAVAFRCRITYSS